MTAGVRGEVILAFDYGKRRIGVAVGNSGTGTASPAGTVDMREQPDWQGIARRLDEWGPARLLVGVPYNMDGSETLLTRAARAFAEQLRQRHGLPVELVDERLTSVEATAELRDARRSGARARRVRREDVDANAARLILETWLRSSRPSTGSAEK
jgi:putative Holliday junction resolvase